MKFRTLIACATLLAAAGCHDSSSSEDAPSPPTSPKRKVLLLGVDGLMHDYVATHDPAITPHPDAPNFQRFTTTRSFSGGYLSTSTQVATLSGPSWSTILTGTYTDQHKVTKNNDQPIANISLFQHLQEKLHIRGGSYASWSNINTSYLSKQQRFINQRVDGKDRPQDMGGDDYVVERVLEELNDEQSRLGVLFIHLDDMDGAGHSCGWGECYSQQLPITDAHVGKLLDAVEQREAKFNEEWLVLYTSDHGHVEKGGHGGQSNAEREIMIGSNRPEQMNAFFRQPAPPVSLTGDERRDEWMGYPGQASLTPTVLSWLGYQATPEDQFQGSSLVGELGAYKVLAKSESDAGPTARVHISWQAGDNVKSQNIYRNGTLVATLDGKQREWIDELAVSQSLPAGSYELRYGVQADVGGTTTSNTVTIILGEPVDVPALIGSAHTALPLDQLDGAIQWLGSGTPSFTNGPHNGQKALRVDRTQGYASLPITLGIGKGHSFSFWFKANRYRSDPNVLSNKNWSSGTNPGFTFPIADGAIKFQGGNGIKRFDTNALSVPIGKWVRITAVFDPTRQGGQLNVNDETSSAFASGVKSITSPYKVINFGEGGDGGYNLDKEVDFEFADFLYFDRALSDLEAKSLQQQYLTS
ncbi:alkaline phosphatase family protein [Aeromonas simiae]|uniref:Nucleotide pyrophosphatase n=1 Tax=Aeromonas simiae TaxID=218936 RepID=A0A5J6WVN8_9GAMM|nr:alkaline phosphatase family protein [Aeromonas simiae]QFI53385.1 hypothetical protein FE240_00820 [Aeromonas simiae]